MSELKMAEHTPEARWLGIRIKAKESNNSAIDVVSKID